MFKKTYHTLNEVVVNPSALIHNFKFFTEINPQAQLALVLKSNAYGHGLVQVASLIDQHIPTTPFICVDSLFEAYELSKIHIKTPILILGYTFPENYRLWKKLKFSFSVFDTQSLKALGAHQPHAKIHLKLDTGMCRLGLTPSQIGNFIIELKRFPSLQVEGIYSHLSQADNLQKKSFTHRQIKLFKQMVGQFEQAGFNFKWRHIAATSAASWMRDSYFNLIRLGLGFYGYSPFSPHTVLGKSQHQSLQPAMTFNTHIAQLKTIESGSQVSYGGTHISTKRETVAILPVGYNDGLNRSLSNQGFVVLQDKTMVPIIGNICMNMTIVKIPKNSSAREGDTVSLIIPEPASKASVYHQAKLLHTIPYTILTGLHPSTRRIIT